MDPSGRCSREMFLGCRSRLPTAMDTTTSLNRRSSESRFPTAENTWGFAMPKSYRDGQD